MNFILCSECGGNLRTCGHSGVMTSVPNQPKTPLRSFRIPDAVYRAAQERAREKGESVSDVVRRALERYSKRA